MRLRTLITTLVVVGTFSLPASAASAHHTTAVRCGDTVTHSVSLANDLMDCPGAGLVIGANHITLNLNGHTISGRLEGAVGIDNSAGYDGVTIENGAVRNFTNGVMLLEHATGNRVQRLTLNSDNSNGGADNGILIFDSDHNRIAHNSISGSFNGIFLGNTTDSTVSRNRVSDVNDGIFLFNAERNAVERNVIAGVAGTGVILVQSSYNRITRNSSHRNGNGIFAVDGSSHNHIEKNVVVGNSDTGVLLDQHADDNVIARNFASGNGFAGIAVGGSDRTLVSRNVASHNPGAGIAVVDASIDTVVERNQANGNGTNPPDCTPDCPLLDDGIHIDAPATTVTDNTSDRNADLGIQAVPGVTDGGGNRARSNGNPLQCTIVDCR